MNLSRYAIDDTPHDIDAPGSSGTLTGVSHLTGSEPDLDGGSGSGYVVRVTLNRDAIKVDGRRAGLRPGMSVTAEILTGKRRIISYLLSPVLRYVHDAGQER